MQSEHRTLKIEQRENSKETRNDFEESSKNYSEMYTKKHQCRSVCGRSGIVLLKIVFLLIMRRAQRSAFQSYALYLCSATLQNTVEAGEEGDGGNGSRQNIADRLCQKNTEYRVRQQVRQDEDERDQQNDLAQTGQQQADLGLTQRHKALLAGDLSHRTVYRNDTGKGKRCGVGSM